MASARPETVSEALRRGADALRGGSPTARLDAELLLGHALGWGRARVLAEGREPLPGGAAEAFAGLLARRAAGEPVAYLVGRREFYGLDFLVDRRVLVPRPETELLVELALAAAARRPGPLEVADIGTGSGCVAVALAANLPRARVSAVDLSPGALDVARENAARNGVAGRVALLQGDLLAPLPGPVDLLVSNPPYTVFAEVDEGVARFEPRLALDAGPDGLAVYRRLIAGAPAALRPGGALLLEIGAWQGDAVAALAAEALPRAAVSVHKDLAGRDRVVVADVISPDDMSV